MVGCYQQHVSNHTSTSAPRSQRCKQIWGSCGNSVGRGRRQPLWWPHAPAPRADKQRAGYPEAGCPVDSCDPTTLGQRGIMNNERTMRSISSVVTPGFTAACAASRIRLATKQACRVPSMSSADLTGTAVHEGELNWTNRAHLLQPITWTAQHSPCRAAPMLCCLLWISLMGTPVSA